jgi:hypothetical protein
MYLTLYINITIGGVPPYPPLVVVYFLFFSAPIFVKKIPPQLRGRDFLVSAVALDKFVFSV